jgi:hypothetical protein
MTPGVRSTLRAALLGTVATLVAAGVAMADRNDDHGQGRGAHHRWYVGASAAAGGDGSANAPFNSLALVQAASGPGDTIVVLPSPLSVPPLDGGIALKPGQRLIGGGPAVVALGAPLVPGGPPVAGSTNLASQPRITNSTGASNNGDAVELADGTEVENLVITGAFRGGIYGNDAVGVSVRGNDLANFDTSGTVGFVVQPFFASSYVAGLGGPENKGLTAGWAAILIDASTVQTDVSISNNYVHDGACGDGIDIRGLGGADVTVQVEHNFVTRLVQCSKVRTIEGIGTQVTGTARMRATLFGNTEADNGNGTANMDSLFVDPAEQGTLVETIDRNVYLTGIGGQSTNGFEYIVSNGNGVSSVTISNSFFQNNPGDMLQELNFGAGATATMTIDHVTVEQTTIARGLPPYAQPPGTLTGATNTGDCLDIVANGANDVTIFNMVDSSFTGCDNNGIEITSNHATGNGDGDIHTIVVNIDHSRIAGSRFYNFWANNITPLTNLKVRVQDSDLSGSTNGVAVAFDQQPTATTASAILDLGGGALGSHGRNCFFDGALLDLEAMRYNISAQNNWWGVPNGPAPGTVMMTPGTKLDTSKPLKHAPSACGGDDNDNDNDNDGGHSGRN